jgi:hypothetical protein
MAYPSHIPSCPPTIVIQRMMKLIVRKAPRRLLDMKNLVKNTSAEMQNITDWFDPEKPEYQRQDNTEK